MSDSNTIRYRHQRGRPTSLTGDEEAWLDARSEAEIEAAAAADPDNPPLTAEQLAGACRVVAVGALRRRLGLTQDEFARRYRLPVGTVRDWEQGRSVPTRRQGRCCGRSTASRRCWQGCWAVTLDHHGVIVAFTLRQWPAEPLCARSVPATCMPRW